MKSSGYYDPQVSGHSKINTRYNTWGKIKAPQEGNQPLVNVFNLENTILPRNDKEITFLQDVSLPTLSKRDGQGDE